MEYENVDFNIESVSASVNGKARNISIQWNTSNNLFTPVNNLNKRLQIIGNKVGECKMSEMELPVDSASDMQKINQGPVTITISRNGNTLTSITGVYDEQRNKSAEELDEELQKKIFMVECTFKIIKI